MSLWKLGVLTLAVASLQGQQATFDLVIQGGRIVDGAGNPWFYADVGIRGDQIAAIGPLRSAPAKTRIDAKGMVVMPGIIDIHSHAGGAIGKNPAMEGHIRQGITTVMEGNDGAGPVPLAEALERIGPAKVSINFGYFVGHGSIRTKVMGLVNRKATPEELEQMKGLAKQAMLDGAFGLSTGLFYVPGNYAPTEEVIEIAKVVAPFGGMHISHMRDEAAQILESVRETIRIGEEGGLPTQITHHKLIGKANWGRSAETLRLVEEARRRGVDVTIDQYPYTASSTGTAAMFPQWSLEGGAKSLAERLQATESRARIRAEIIRRLEEDRGAGDPANVQFAHCAFDPTLDGKNLADAVKRKNLPPTMENAADTAIEIQSRGGCSAIYHAISEDDLQRIMRSPWTMFATDGEAPVLGEASPHPRAYGTFPRVLGRYVREKHVLTLEDAVRRMTGMPADRLRLQDRGLIRVGMKADLLVMDPERIIDRSEFTKPHQYSEGIRDVVVNGVPVLLGGTMTGARPGRALYGPGRH